MDESALLGPLLFFVLSLSFSFVQSSERCANRWVIELKDDYSSRTANDLAIKYGLVNHGPVGRLKRLYDLEGTDRPKACNRSLAELLLSESGVVFAEQQVLQERNKRAFSLPSDPLWDTQWPWYNTGQYHGTKGLDINALRAWMQGFTGNGTVVAVIDDGVEVTHPDLQDNIATNASFSFYTNTSDPSPIFSFDEYSHGTSCAGEIAMIKSNGYCGAGVAHNTKLAALQLDFDDLLPVDEARAFTYDNDYIQVYSNSWGPPDTGFKVGGPGYVGSIALASSVANGRQGKGNIFVFASGNGGEEHDSCAADGFVNSIYTIAVGSADQNGNQAYYDENCSAKMATTYSYNSDVYDGQVTTTHVGSLCVQNFTGTSASAPLVAGVVALALEVNPALTWRDMQYLFVYTSNPTDLNDGGFTTNGAGLQVGNKFGFGAVDAEAIVTRARYWIPVPDVLVEEYTVLEESKYRHITVKSITPSTLTIDLPNSTNITYLEHVLFNITFTVISDDDYNYYDYYDDPSVINHPGPRRGDASIVLCSPSGTCSTILPERPNDYITEVGYDNWPLLSLQFWGENPVGQWTVKTTFSGTSGGIQVESYAMTLRGTAEIPAAVAQIPSQCDPVCALGCAASGPEYCDACASGYVRDASTLVCQTSCDPGLCELDGYCVLYDGACPETLSTLDIILIVVFSVLGAVILLVVVVFLILCCMRKAKLRRELERYNRLPGSSSPDSYYSFEPQDKDSDAV